MHPTLTLPLPCLRAGEIRRLRLVADEDGRSAGVAFITFTDMPAVRAAVALADSLVVDGRQPSVQPAHREVAGDCEGGHCGEEEEAAAPHAPAPGSDPAPAPGARDSPLQRSRSSGLSASASHLPAAEAAGAMHRASSSPALSGLAAPPAPYSPPVFSAVSGAGAGAITGPGEQSTDTLFVRPLGADTDEAALRQLFAAHPGLTFVRVLRHADGASKCVLGGGGRRVPLGRRWKGSMRPAAACSRAAAGCRRRGSRCA